jgi:hypothetical protein
LPIPRLGGIVLRKVALAEDEVLEKDDGDEDGELGKNERSVGMLHMTHPVAEHVHKVLEGGGERVCAGDAVREVSRARRGI